MNHTSVTAGIRAGRQCRDEPVIRRVGVRSRRSTDRRLGLLLAGRPRHRAAPVVGLPATDGSAVGGGVGRAWTSRPAAARCSPARRAFRRRWSPPSPGRRTRRWPPQLLHPRGVVVVATADEPTLPFADEAFDLVTSRHADRGALARRSPGCCGPGGSYLAQQIGPATMSELFEFFLGPQPAQMGRAANRKPRPRRPRPPGWRSSRCGWSGFGRSSSTSAR